MPDAPVLTTPRVITDGVVSLKLNKNDYRDLHYTLFFSLLDEYRPMKHEFEMYRRDMNGSIYGMRLLPGGFGTAREFIDKYCPECVLRNLMIHDEFPPDDCYWLLPWVRERLPDADEYNPLVPQVNPEHLPLLKLFVTAMEWAVNRGARMSVFSSG